MGNESKNYINGFILLKDSSMLYGVAIILMIFHHCFCIPARLHYNYIPVFFNFETEARLAYIGKLCVAIYAFVSGYAFAQKHNNKSSFFARFFYNIRISVSTLIKFYSKLWLVCIIFLPIGIVFFDKSNSVSSIVNAFLFGKGGYNNEWWYIAQYLKFLFVFPFLEIFFHYLLNKKTWFYSVSFAVVGLGFVIITRVFFWDTTIGYLVSNLSSTYMVIFVIAYTIGKLRIFEWTNEKKQVPWVVYIIVILLLLVARWVFVYDPADGKIDIFLSPFIIYSLVQLFHIFNLDRFGIQRRLSFLGKYSTFMWLVHTFWIYYYFQDIILLPRYSILILIWAMMINLVTAIILEWLLKITRVGKLAKYCSNFVLSIVGGK